MSNDVQHLFTYLLAFVYLLWRNFYFHPLLILKLNVVIFVTLNNLKVNRVEALPDIIKAFHSVGCVEYW